ncbi:putative membrane protein [Alteromonas macleodii]|uniref:Membrane protein n=1 Tax=Alteromonas macleodii TaxID=28108 RepID=A0AB36FR61_ALTMA|nr:putative membrane protein [Alteromonas macleodii]OES25374.1 putative membrane protein [Alteromonas macleodii]OES25383.1 putative membrane protein [Alteromonas macleodii]OES38688.1 putative membrane protein [Alteromonas macleodii]
MVCSKVSYVVVLPVFYLSAFVMGAAVICKFPAKIECVERLVSKCIFLLVVFSTVFARHWVEIT